MNSASNPNDPWDVFLPLKQFDAGKSRLGNIPADFRVSLIKAMAVDVIDVLLQLPQISSITIVGVNHEQLTDNANPHLRSFPISQPVDINSDLQMAIGDSNRIAIFLPDLPSVKTTEISKALELACGHRTCLLYTSPSPRDRTRSRMPSSA